MIYCVGMKITHMEDGGRIRAEALGEIWKKTGNLRKASGVIFDHFGNSDYCICFLLFLYNGYGKTSVGKNGTEHSCDDEK